MSASAAGIGTLGGAPARPPRSVAPHEFLPTWLIYAPVALQWAALAIRHRSLTLPCLANPHVPTGGLCGESKSAILDAVAGPARDALAPYVAFRTGRRAKRRAWAAMEALGLDFPVVLKPDIGCRGVGVRLVGDAARLEATLAAYPPRVHVLLQAFVPWEGEAGIFYSRRPGEARGRIVGVTTKTAPHVEGDGVRTLRALVAGHPRAGRVPHVYLRRLEARPEIDLDRVPAPGERIRLVFTGNHSKGSVFRDAFDLVTPALEAACERIVGAMPDFHHGRLDVRFADPDALARGEAFRVIEINGIGAEPIQMWDPEKSLVESLAAVLGTSREAFRTGAALRARGFRPPRVRRRVCARCSAPGGTRSG